MSSMPENAALTLPWLARGRALASLSNADDAAKWLVQNGAHRAARILQKGSVAASSTLDSDVGSVPSRIPGPGCCPGDSTEIRTWGHLKGKHTKRRATE